jgi:hypothetical protein
MAGISRLNLTLVGWIGRITGIAMGEAGRESLRRLHQVLSVVYQRIFMNQVVHFLDE